MTAEHATDISVCVDCLFLLANGEVTDGEGNDVTAEHAARMDAIWQGANITLGTLEHEDGCDLEETGDCECDQYGFSWRSCDGCGSSLGGDRFAATAWT